MCCCSWGCKESDMTERLNWTEDSSGFPGSSDSKESACNAGDLGWIFHFHLRHKPGITCYSSNS